MEEECPRLLFRSGFPGKLFAPPLTFWSKLQVVPKEALGASPSRVASAMPPKYTSAAQFSA